MDTVRLFDPIDAVAPAIHGHFAEHLGRCIYDGIALDPDHDYADRPETVGDTDLRADALDLLADVGVPVLRWPGGCFADDYHWRDGVGEDRPRRRNLWWAQGRGENFEEPNAYGTEEFLRTCRELDAEPYLSANVGSGDPTEAADWAEYCNGDGDTEPVAERAANGHPDPHAAPYWGVGNENWGCGGDYTPAEYAGEYRRFANYLASVDRNLSAADMEFVACGHLTEDWNRDFLDAVGPDARMDHLSVHRYYDAGEVGSYDEEDHFRLFARAAQVAADVDRAAAALDAYGRDAGVIVDEWGVWHPSATADNGLEQPNTVRDAVSAAGVLDDLQARADRVAMANIAQTVNVLQSLVETDDRDAWPTPTYRAFDLYAPHRGGTAVRTQVGTGERTVTVGGEERDVPLLSAAATRSEEGVYVTLSNRALESREVELAADPTDASAECLFADLDPAAHTTGEDPGRFAPAEHAVEADDGAARIEVPPTAVVGVRLPNAM